MKYGLLLIAFAVSASCNAQPDAFPKSWVGNWKGELHWYKTGTAAPQKVAMILRIHPADSAGTYTWQLIYGAGGEDNRPYKLIPKDTAGIHWVVDEQNGILLDQFWVGNKLCGAFTVMHNTIINNYQLENGRLLIEFYSISSKPITTSGDGTDETPKVDSYRVGSYQRAVLTRQ
jgi:hypothetical protein